MLTAGPVRRANIHQHAKFPPNWQATAHACARWPVRTCSRWAILHRFPNFYTLGVEVFRNFVSIHVYVWPLWTMKNIMEIGLHVFPKSGTQTHRQTDSATLYIIYIVGPELYGTMSSFDPNNFLANMAYCSIVLCPFNFTRTKFNPSLVYITMLNRPMSNNSLAVIGLYRFMSMANETGQWNWQIFVTWSDILPMSCFSVMSNIQFDFVVLCPNCYQNSAQNENWIKLIYYFVSPNENI